MYIAILTFQGFNELDSLVALGVLNRIRAYLVKQSRVASS